MHNDQQNKHLVNCPIDMRFVIRSTFPCSVQNRIQLLPVNTTTVYLDLEMDACLAFVLVSRYSVAHAELACIIHLFNDNVASILARLAQSVRIDKLHFMAVMLCHYIARTLDG